MRNILKKAHELTREMKVKYPEIDYKSQLGIFMSCLYNEENQEKTEVKRYRNYGTFTRKQIGVIYSAMKRGKIEVESKFVSELYGYYVDLEGSAARENYNRNSIICDSIEEAIEAIFLNDYAEAQKNINRAQMF